MGKSVPSRKSFKSTVYSHIQNVDSHIDNVRNSLEHLVFTNEKEVERALFKKRIKVVVGLTLIFMVIGTYFSPKGKAEVATFFPSACLGGWNNPHNAEGHPETLDAAPAFSLSNSASLAKDVVADLYCGGFKGEVPTETVPTKIMLTIAWRGLTDGEVQPIVGSSFASSSLEVLDATSSEGFTLDASSTQPATTTDESNAPSNLPSLEAGTSTETAPPTVPSVVSPDASDTTSVPVPPSSPAPPSSEQESSPALPPAAPASSDTAPQSWLYKLGDRLLSLFVSTVYALDETMVASSTEVAPSTSDDGATSPSLDDTMAASSTEVASSTNDAGTTTQSFDVSDIATLSIVTSTSTSQTQVANPMFEILYTLDGEAWFSLGKVSAEDMSYNKFEIPVTSSSTWDDISNIQIKVMSLVTPDAKPTVLVDGMVLDVEYEKAVIAQVEGGDIADPKRYDMKVIDMTGYIAADIFNDPSQGMTLNISASSSASLIVYKDVTGEVIFSSGIGTDPLPINSYMFDPGTFTVVVTGRENGCVGLTSTECENDKETIGFTHFIISPTKETPIKFIHTE